MEKTRSSPLSFLFPWLAPLVISFALANGGIEIQLYRNNRLLKDWHPSQFRHVLPEPLIKWIDDNHFHRGPQPYPLAKQLCQYLIPLASKKLIIDASALTELQEGSQPQNFALVWTLNHTLGYIEGKYTGADRYLGMGWFQQGTNISLLEKQLSTTADSQLKHPFVSIQQADSLLTSIIPDLRQYVPTYADFQLITDFALRVIVPDAHSGKLTLTLECNYPQFLPIVQFPQPPTDILLAKHALIRFPQRTLTPVLMQLLQNNPSITIQGPGVPHFIREQLPIMRQWNQISDEMAAKIMQSNPIVSLATLQPVRSFVHLWVDGIGSYVIAATYQYHQQPLDMDALLAARQRNQRFAQQHDTWFEWPEKSKDLVHTIQQQRAAPALRPEEVMGFDTRRIALLPGPPPAHAIQPGGTTPAARAQSLFEQLRLHGIPGGILGEPKGLSAMFIEACRNLVENNWQARILWLAPSNKKGSVTRAIHNSMISSHVTIASLVTLRDELTLLSHPWTLVIFQEGDHLLDGSSQSWALFQLKWQWALVSVTSQRTLNLAITRVLHLPEQCYGQFCSHFLFDVEKTYQSVVPDLRRAGSNVAQVATPITPKKDARASVSPLSSSAPQTARMSSSVSAHPPVPAISPLHLPSQNISEFRKPLEQSPAQLFPDSAKTKPAPFPIRHAIELNSQKIVRLREESEQLQERLTVEGEEEQEQPFINVWPDPAPASPEIRETIGSVAEADEDWQNILQQWQPEHWEIIRLLCQGQPLHLTTAQRKDHRPLSRLIDEINSPVDEQLGDLLIDPETQTLAPHLHAIAENLVYWYFSSQR